MPKHDLTNVWVVIPTYNECESLGAVLASLRHLPVTVTVVDDGSTDGSHELAISNADWTLQHFINLGQGAALQTGIQFALEQGAETIVTFDADGQHDPQDILTLVRALRDNNADFALGSRFKGQASNMPLSRKLTLKFGVLFTRVISGIDVTDTHNGLRAFTRRGASAINLKLNRMEHSSEILDQIKESGLKYVEAPVSIGYSAYSLAKGQRSTAAFRIVGKLLAERMR